MHRATALTLAVTAVLSGCTRAAQPAAIGAAPMFDDEVTIVIVNNNFYDATIFAEYSGETQRRLGLVTGHTQDTFKLHYSPRPLRMVMRLVGPRIEKVSDELYVDPGDILELELLANMHRRN